jgi:hypothetical protein
MVFAAAACDRCGEYFAGDPHHVIEAVCARCGAGLRPCTEAEVLAYLNRSKRDRLPPSDGAADADR